ncbi:MAG: SDR family oxidoreductase [Firmicutes bacterium]|nr:SDR family oxidoreductase [Bacillota bacterium]MBR1989767.1 SDR family oxidoreductase [Bacillota bacterium]
MELGLKDKVVAITGGTSGIGEELALAFAREGCKVAVCGRNEAKISNMKERFDEYGLELFAFQADISDLQQLRGFIEHTTAHYDKLDILINNAGTTVRKPFVDYTEEEWYRVVDTNMKAMYFGCVYGAAQMKKNGGGVIINTSSFTSVIPTCGSALYSGTKAAVDKMTAVFAAELAADKIRVVSVQPGMTVTPLTEEKCRNQYDELISQIAMKRLATPDDMVGAYLFLASDRAAYINGVSLPVAGAKLTVQNPHYSYT